MPASDLAIEKLWPLDSPLTSIGSTSHLDETDETDTAVDDRIFFGPLQSPEKKYAAPSGGSHFRTPIRRSSRLSTPIPPISLSDQDVTDATRTRDGTPDEDAMEDEPSLVLASRVLSACSNPSPPPSPRSLPETPFELEDAPILDTSDTPGLAFPDISTGPLIPVENLDFSESMLADPLPVLSSNSTPQPTDLGNISQPDLINFDSFSTPTNHSNALSKSTPSHDPQFPSSLPFPSSVDDLLAISPRTGGESSINLKPDFNDLPLPDREPSPTSVEEMAVASSLDVDATHESSRPAVLTDSEQRLTPEAAAPVVQPQVPTPLRRSTRPRKSREIQPQPVAGSSSQPPSELVSPGEDVEQERNPLRKRKLKVPPLQQETEIASHTPRRPVQMTRLHRVVGSLSPMSAAVLTQLLPTGTDSTNSHSSFQPPTTSQDSGIPFLQDSQAPGPSTPSHEIPAFVFPKVGQAGVVEPEASRPRSPLRPFSHFKFEERPQSPARRVPIEQAIAEGTYSPSKLPAAFGAVASQPRMPGSPVFKRIDLDDPMRSPAKRVPMSQAVIVPPSPGKSTDKGKVLSRPLYPARASSVPPSERESRPLLARRVRAGSAEPSILLPGRTVGLQKSASVDGVGERTPLPYPLVQEQRIPPSIQEEEEPGPSLPVPLTGANPRINGAVQRQTSPSKAASSLRQPSAGAGSKIPRAGVKPYARQKVSAASTLPSKLPTPRKAKPVLKPKPVRIVTVGSTSSGSSSDEGQGLIHSRKPAPSAPAPILQPRRVVGPSSSTTLDAAPPHGLKRKREAEPSGSKSASSATQPMLVMRKVVPGMFNKGKDAAVSSVNLGNPSDRSIQKTTSVSPVKSLGPIKARSAMGWKRPQQPQDHPLAPVSPVQTAEAPVKEPSPEPIPVPSANAEVSQPVVAVEDIEAPPQVEALVSCAEVPTIPANDVAGPTAASSSPAPVEVAGQPSLSQPHRRSTRSKRNAAPTTDVFGSIAPPTRPAQRRRGLLLSETAGPFAGMSALALKTLTSANTVRNQQQVAKIQTEVVRKEGSRPDSPTTRVRTALEQQKETRAQQRKERAERRARRAAGSDVSVDTDADMDSSETLVEDGIVAVSGAAAVAEGDGHGESTGAGPGGLDDAGEDYDASFMSVETDQDGVPLRHRRGPGDETDYETPQRPERPVKRGRFDGDEGKERMGSERRVKWDRGLHTTVYLDDTPPNPKWNVTAVPSLKSCLTPGAKALRLDTLGNVLNAELPVGGLVKENVLVKKFVFDDEEPPVASPAPAAAAKSTRSKGKKAKS